MVCNELRIQGLLSEDLGPHLALLVLNERIQLAQNGLQSLITALVVLEELLHVFQGVTKFGLMNQGQLVIIGVDNTNLLVYHF